MRKSVLWLIAAICLVPSVFAQETVPAANVVGYQIGPGDVVEGKVLGEEQFNFTATVDENGNIEVPFFEKPVRAMCRTETELRSEVTKLVARYVRNPLVSVQVKERKSRPPATVYGEVRQPQQVILTRRATLREILAFSGGVTKEASGMVQITRTQPPLCSEDGEDWKNSRESGLGFPSRLYSLSSLKDVNPEIFPGDVIDVQKASPVYVVGEVMKPGEMFLPEGGLPLMQAIAMAGGTTREAQKKELKIYRRREGTSQPEVITVNYDLVKKGQEKDIMLEPFDIVEVGKSKKNIGDIFLEALTGIPNRMPIPVRTF
jgi:Periplasmic protein involved in polysaccharide export